MRFGGLSVLTDVRFRVTIKVGWQLSVSFDRCHVAACQICGLILKICHTLLPCHKKMAAGK